MRGTGRLQGANTCLRLFPPAQAGGPAAAWDKGVLLFLFFHSGGLVRGDNLVGDHLRHDVVV
jgi:hypothetical protein